MAGQNTDKLVEAFTTITGVEDERAKFFLEAAAWNLEMALENFCEDGEDQGASDLGDRPEADGAASPTKTTAKKTKPTSRVNMVSGDSSSDEEQQAFYTGGSEHSGQQILGPPKSKKDLVTQLFKSAREHGAEVLEKFADSKKVSKVTFSGTGYRLGETDNDTQVIPGVSSRESVTRDVTLRMWRTGFTVDGGPLRDYTDSANTEFLNSVKRSEVPSELVRQARGGEVYINMEDHRHEDFVAAKHLVKAFTGSGHTLGSPAPTVIGQVLNTNISGGATGTTVYKCAVPTANPVECEDKAKSDLKIDASQPTTNIQIRLPDGSRLVLKLNHSSTVGDIRQYIRTARPQYQETLFVIMTIYPHEEVSNDSNTITEAKLINAALVVKVK